MIVFQIIITSTDQLKFGPNIFLGKPPALLSMPGTSRPMALASHRADPIRRSTSNPVWYPDRSSMYATSSVGTLPVARGANGQPPMPPRDASTILAPAWTAAHTLATPVFRVL